MTATHRAPGWTAAFAAPGRVNLIGEHTDYNAGTCLPIALPHVTTATVRRRDDDLLSLRSRQLEGRLEIGISDIAPDRVTGWTAYVAGVAWALGQDGLVLPGMDLEVDSAVPVGAGLSSSAALVCSAALAMCAAAGVDADPADLVAPTMRAESEVAGAPTGGMDQTVSLLAREGTALLIDFADHSTRHVAWRPEDAGLGLLVVDTRASHALTDGGYGSRRADCENAAQAIGLRALREATREQVEGLADELLRRRARHVVTEIDRVDRAVAAVEASDWQQVGALFTASHVSLRDDFEVSCAELDLVVETALAEGALGARMTGGGFGGSAIALVRREDADRVVDRIMAAFAQRRLTAPVAVAAPASAGARQVG